MANSIFPDDLMLSILTRLPVKSIIRFKSVCKPWYDLFSTPEFKKLHLAQFSTDPKNQSYIAHTSRKYYRDPENQFSIFNIESYGKMPTILDHPFAHEQHIDLDTLGSCNGLVCIRRGNEIVLWNPAMKLSKTFPLKDYGRFKKVSLGFGYDAIGDDFKVVMIVTNMYGEGKNDTSVEIYSVNLGSWITIGEGFQYHGFQAKNNLIVNGNPYWVAHVDRNKVLLRFDVSELVFKIVPEPGNCWNYWYGLSEEIRRNVDLSILDDDTYTDAVIVTEKMVYLVDWHGDLGTLIINNEVEYRNGPEDIECSSRVECARVWVFDDIEQIWRNVRTFGPIDVSVDRFLHCIRNEKILGVVFSDKLFVLDLETARVKGLLDGARLGNSFEVYGYTESLAYVTGMEKEVVKYDRNDLDD